MTNAATGAPHNAPRQTNAARPTGRQYRRRTQAPSDIPTTRLAWLLCAVVVLAPLPIGSNRPGFWALNGLVYGLLALWYAVSLILRNETQPIRLRRFWPEAMLFCLFLAVIAIQLAPLMPFFEIPGWNGTTDAAQPAFVFSYTPGDTVFALIQFLTFGLLFWLGLQAGADRHRARQAVTVLFWAVCAYATYGLLALSQLGDTILGFEKAAYLGFATSTFINRNSFATYLAIGLALGLALLVDTRSKPLSERLTGSLLLTVGLGIILAALFMTGSRMGLFAGLCGAVVILLVSRISSGPSRAITSLLLILSLMLVAGLGAVFASGTLDRLIWIQGDFAGRAELYQQVWALIMQRPLTGWGGGSFPAIFQVYQAPPLPGQFVYLNTHSSYLSLWFEYGLVAGTLPLLAIVGLTIRSAAGLRHSEGHRAPSLAAIGVLTAVGLHALVDFSLEIQAVALTFVLILAFSVAARPSSGRRSPEPPPDRVRRREPMP